MNDSQHRHLIEICNRPGMYVGSNDFEKVCAFIDGLHAANGCLVGFREWLIVEVDTGNNLVWWGLVGHAIHWDSTPAEERVQRLGELIDEFYKFTGSTIGATNGLMRVYVRYHGWLLRQKWYKPDWIGYVPPYDQKSESTELRISVWLHSGEQHGQMASSVCRSIDESLFYRHWIPRKIAAVASMSSDRSFAV